VAALHLQTVLTSFGVEAAYVDVLKQSENTHWAVNGSGGKSVLRLVGGPPGFRTPESVRWECDLLRALAEIGAPTPRVLAGPEMFEGDVFVLFSFVEGKPWEIGGSEEDYRTLGRLLADFHIALASIPAMPQRAGWRPVAEGALPASGGPQRRRQLLNLLARVDADAARLVESWARNIEVRLAEAGVDRLPLMAVHADFSPWNIVVRDGKLVGVFDFDFAHLDIRAADVCFARRGYHDGVVRGYLEKAPLSRSEIRVLDALWVGSVLTGVWRCLELNGDHTTKAHLTWFLEQLVKTRAYRD
jgi:Ser/Thr protein kinase RdoA (MazF antagonist)